MIPVTSGATLLLYRASWAAQRAVAEDRLSEDLVQDVEDALLICEADGLEPEIAEVVQAMVDVLRELAHE